MRQTALPCVMEMAARVVAAPEPSDKVRLAHAVAEDWNAGRLQAPERGARACAPDAPGRPPRPELRPPAQVPKRKLGNPEGRFALMHAVAHIELNAIDLHFDMVARFAGDPRIADDQRQAFVSDWISVGDDEARHFTLVRRRLQEMGGDYGDVPAHDGLWESASNTADDLAARLAIAPLVLEARGLDVTPMMIDKLQSVGDAASVAILKVIYDEEVGHVAAGARWFEHVCRDETQSAEHCFHRLVSTYFHGALKRPFNEPARTAAGLPGCFYEPLADVLS
ncbi:ferritin-like domain-containing protein [Oceanicaulis sp. LC35]|uniref:ferritin-like domain-containing protein n=1 Tax=Oceanicaulis sp. LC35 TaxID=3349635 RepID=UPI003F873992